MKNPQTAPKPTLTPDEAEVLSILRSLSPEDRRKASAILKAFHDAPDLESALRTIKDLGLYIEPIEAA